MGRKRTNKLNIFFQQSGLKILAIAKFNSCEYSILLYLLNGAISDINEIITNYTEFSSLINYSIEEIVEALKNLEQQKIIKILKNKNQTDVISLRLEFDPQKWSLNTDKTKISTDDAVIFPFKKITPLNLSVLNGKKNKLIHKRFQDNSDNRILKAFLQNRSLSEAELNKAEEDAKILSQTYPVDQVLLFIRYFKNRIPSLSLLASMWQHYQEMFEHETQKIDFANAKQKHIHMDLELKNKVKIFIESQEYENLTEEEKTVLNILLKHRHPRRQLFWAYQEKNRYTNLLGFFKKVQHLMLPITSSGKLFHRNHNNNSQDEE